MRPSAERATLLARLMLRIAGLRSSLTGGALALATVLAGMASAAAGVAGAAAGVAGAESPSSPPGGSAQAAEFFAHSKAGPITCAMYDGGAGVEVLCESYGPPTQSKATLDPSGEVTACRSSNMRRNACGLGNAGIGTPTYGYGRRVTVGRFACKVLHRGVRCIARATGKGFLFNPDRTVGVGGAKVRHLPRRNGHSGVWMVGPGCGGRLEWLRHPSAFPYFCDGAALVEKVIWQHWGKPTATATGTFDEALLTSHNSVATAPRRISAVTITASRIKRCDGHRLYTSVVIRYKSRGLHPLSMPSAYVCSKAG